VANVAGDNNRFVEFDEDLVRGCGPCSGEAMGESLIEPLELPGVRANVRVDDSRGRRWRIWMSMSGPDARYRPASIDLSPAAVEAVRRALDLAAGEVARLGTTVLPATYRREFLDSSSIQVVVEAMGPSRLIKVEMTSATGFIFSMPLQPAALRQWISELDRAISLGPELEAALETMSPRAPRNESVSAVRTTLPDRDSTKWQGRKGELADLTSGYRAYSLDLTYRAWNDEAIPLDRAILEQYGYSESDRTRPADAPGPYRLTYKRARGL
jgi:hypothetical protein